MSGGVRPILGRRRRVGHEAGVLLMAGPPHNRAAAPSAPCLGPIGHKPVRPSLHDVCSYRLPAQGVSGFHLSQRTYCRCSGYTLCGFTVRTWCRGRRPCGADAADERGAGAADHTLRVPPAYGEWVPRATQRGCRRRTGCGFSRLARCGFTRQSGTTVHPSRYIDAARGNKTTGPAYLTPYRRTDAFGFAPSYRRHISNPPCVSFPI